MAALSIAQVASAWVNNGGHQTAVVAAVCCAFATSGGDPGWVSGDGRVGLWGIDVQAWSGLTGLSRADLLTRGGSAKAAVYVSGNGASFGRWPVMYADPAKDAGSGVVTFPQYGSAAFAYVGAVVATLDASGSSLPGHTSGTNRGDYLNAVDKARALVGYTMPSRWHHRDNVINALKGLRR